MIQGLPARAMPRAPRPARDSDGYWFVAPFFVLFLGFAAFGLLFSFFVSLSAWDPIGGTGEFRFHGLRGYVRILEDANFWAALGRSLRESLPGIFAQHIVALPLAFSLYLVFRRARGALGTLFFLPYITSPIGLSAALGVLTTILFTPINDVLGFLNGLPLLETFVPSSLNSYSAFEAFSGIWNTVGWNVLLYLMALGALPRSVLEAAQVDGAGFWVQFSRIAFPIVRPMVFVAFSMSLVSGLQVNAWSASFDGFPEVSLPAYIVGTAFKYLNFDQASTMTWVFFFVMLGIIGVAYALFGRNFTAIETPASLESDHAPLNLPPVTTVILKLAVGAAVIFTVFPLVLLLSQATQNGSFEATTVRFDRHLPDNYAELLGSVPDFWRNFWNSLYVSGLATLGATLASGAAGFAFAALEFRFKRALFAVVMGAMVFPAMSNAIPFLMQMKLFDWIDTPRSLWIPSMVSAIGVFLVRQFTLNTVPRSLLEAARIDGANNFVIFTRVALPLMVPVLSTVALLTFVTTWNHLEAAVLLLRSDATRLLPQALAAFQYDSQGVAVTGAAIGLIPPLLMYALTAGQLGRGLGLSPSVTAHSSLWVRLKTGVRSLVSRSGDPRVVTLGNLAGADGVRAFACLTVVLGHVFQRLNQPEQIPLVQEIQGFLMSGFGVSAFFVLSGMLLSFPFWRRYLDGQPAPNLREYARRRFVRIAPGFYAALIVSFFIARSFKESEFMWLRLFSGLSFTSAFHYVTFFPVDIGDPLWSIGFEVVCYALMPAFMIGLFALARGLPRVALRTATRTTTRTSTRTSTRTTPNAVTETVTRTTTRVTVREPATKTALARGGTVEGSAPIAFAYWIGVLVVTLLVHGWILTNLVPDSERRGWQYGLVGGAKFWTPNYNVVGLFGHYIIGVLTAGFIAYRQRLIRLGLLENATSRRFDVIALGAFALSVALVFARSHFRVPEFALSLGAQPYSYPIYPLLIALTLGAAPFATRAARILDTPFMRYTARISFGLYIWHYPVLELVRLFHEPRLTYFGISNFWEWLGMASFIVIASYVVASLSYKHIEAPFLKEARPGKPVNLEPRQASTSTPV
jgi:ABC-type glycerol-3-phosphate transport system permease component/peptidoglycan/LPS O-acetylase OafA/YrhL